MTGLARWLAIVLVASSGCLVAGIPSPALDDSASVTSLSDATITDVPTPLDVGAGVAADFNQSSAGEPAPVVTLTPVAPPDVNMAGTGVLTPELETQHYYNGSQTDPGNGTAAGAVTLQLNVTYNHPSVALDHSIYITDIVCEQDTLLRARFDSPNAYAFAEANWPGLVANGGSMVLITSASTCGAHEEQNAFFLATALEFDDVTLSFVAHGQEAALNDLMEVMQVTAGGAALQLSNDTVGQKDVGNSSSQSGCGSPAADTLDGLPAVPCGTGFDAALDAKLGYYDANDSNIRSLFGLRASGGSPGVALMRRGFWDDLGDFISDIAGEILSAAEAIVKAAVDAMEFIANTVESIIEIAVDIVVAAYKLAEFIITGEYDDSWTLGLHLMPGSDDLVDSPWGEAVKVWEYPEKDSDDGFSKSEAFSKSKEVLESIRDDLLGEPNPEPGIEIYCIECGVRGSATIRLHLSVHPFDGVADGSIGITGDLYAGVYVGVNAFAQVEKKATKQLISRGLPGWSIPGIISVGPELSLSIEAGIEATAEGQLFAGASLTWPAFEATLGIGDTKSTSSGWDPIVDKKFNVHGEVTATAHLGIPIKLFFGVDIFEGAIKIGASLVDMPALVAEAKFEAEADIAAGTGSIGSDSCAGVELEVRLENKLSLELDPGGSWDLATWPPLPTLTSVCLGKDKSGDEEEEDEPAQPTPTAGPDLEGTVTCPDDDGRVWRNADGKRFTISCHDASINNVWHIAFNVTDNFNQCIEWCAKDVRCAGVTYIDNHLLGMTINIFPYWGTRADGQTYNCAMDGNRPPTGMVEHSGWSATPVDYQDEVAANVSCPAWNNRVYTDGHNLSWRVHCSGPMPWYQEGSSRGPLRTLQACMDYCSANPDCSGALWSPVNGACQTGTKNPTSQAPDDKTGPMHSLELLNPHGIVSVMFGKLDVTDYAKANWATGTRLMIDTDKLWNDMPLEKQKYYNDDDEYTSRTLYDRPIFMLFTYGGVMKSWVGGSWMGTVTMYPPFNSNGPPVPGIAYVPGAASTNLTFPSNANLLTRPFGIDYIRIIEVCYALSQQRTTAQWSDLYRTSFGYNMVVEFSSSLSSFWNPDLYWNNWPNAPSNVRWMVVWFKDTRKGENGPLYAVSARSGELLMLMSSDGKLLNAKRGDNDESHDIDLRRGVAASSGTVRRQAINGTSLATGAGNSTITDTTTTIAGVSGSNSATAGHTTLIFGNATIQDTTGALALYPGLNGNLLIAAASGATAANLSILTGNATLTAVTLPGNGTAASGAAAPELFVGGDSTGRVLHYFPDELLAVGASRLRLATRDKLPRGSRLAGLLPEPSQGMLLAFDASAGAAHAAVGRKPLYLVLCDVADQINRVFVVRNTTAAALADAFQADGREFVLTGGKASNCGPLPLVASLVQAGEGEEAPAWLS